MKSFKLFLIIGGMIVVIIVTAIITSRIQSSIHHKRLMRKSPHLAKLLGDKKPKDLLVTIKTVRAIDALDLNDEQSARFISLTRKRETLRKEYHKSLKDKLEELDRLVKANASDNELQKVIKELDEAEERFRTDTKKIKDDINSILTPEQQARLILFEKEFAREMQRFIEKQPHGRKGRRGRGEIGPKRFRESTIGQKEDTV